MTEYDEGHPRGGPGAGPGPGRRRPGGPPPGTLATIALVLSVAGVVVPVALAGATFPGPDATPEVVAAYLDDRTPALWAGVLAFAASVPTGIYAATVYARLLRLGIRVPGPGIAFFGGVSASVLLAASGLLTWSLAEGAPGVPAEVLRLLLHLVFALGGIGFVGGLGLLVAGIAVPGLILRLVPRWLAWTGLVLAVASEVSFLALLWAGFDVLLPLGRFVGLLWLAVAGFLLPHDRHQVKGRPE